MRAIRKPYRINREGFPDPGAGNPLGASPAETEEQFFASLAHRAVHGGAPDDRRLLADYAARWLLEGRELPPSLREWLAFVLQQLEDTPHRHVGRPRDPRAELEFIMRLARFEAGYKGRLVKVFNLDAEEHFRVSESTIKRARADPRYKLFLDTWREDQKAPGAK